jgi:hypothetical protein
MLRSLFLIAALSTTAVACKDASGEIVKFADQACACKDAACADKVIADFAKWAHDNKDARGDEKKAAEAAERMATCAIKAGADAQKMMDSLSDLAK